MNTGKSEDEIYDGVVEMVQGGMVDGIVLAYSQKNDAILFRIFNHETFLLF